MKRKKIITKDKAMKLVEGTAATNPIKPNK